MIVHAPLYLGIAIAGRPDRARWRSTGYTRPLPVLTVTTWPGAYGRAQAAAMIEPYRRRGRVDVHARRMGRRSGRLSRAVTSHTYKGDVIDFELPKAIAGLPPGPAGENRCRHPARRRDGAPAAQDFVPGALGRLLGGQRGLFPGDHLFAKRTSPATSPQRLADFFDTAKFPGPRALNARRQVQSGNGAAGRRRGAAGCL